MAQVFAVEFDQIKRDQHGVRVVPLVPNKVEYRQAVFVGVDRLGSA